MSLHGLGRAEGAGKRGAERRLARQLGLEPAGAGRVAESRGLRPLPRPAESLGDIGGPRDDSWLPGDREESLGPEEPHTRTFSTWWT